jgi:hypothetical protein
MCSQNIKKDQGWNYHITTWVTLQSHCTKAYSYAQLPQTNIKVTHRSTIPLVAILWQPSCRPKHHCPQVKPVGSVAVVQPDSSGQDQTDPSAPPDVPLPELVAVEPQRPAELLSVPLPPQPAIASQRCSVTGLTSRCRQHPRPLEV